MKKLLLFLSLLLPLQAFGGAAFVQNVDKNWFSGSGTTETVTFVSTPGAGNTIVCYTAWLTTTSNITSVKDGNNTAYTVIDNTTNGTLSQASDYVLANSAGNTGAKSITVTWGADPGSGSLQCHEVSGVATSNVLDVHTINIQVNPGTGTNAVTSGNVTPTANGDYLFGASADGNAGTGTWVAGTNVAWTGEGTSGSWYFSEQFVQTTAAAVAATFTNPNAFTQPITVIVALKVPSGPSGSNIAGPSKLAGGSTVK